MVDAANLCWLSAARPHSVRRRRCLLQLAIARGLPASELVLVTASATLLLAMAAAAFAYRAFNRSNLVMMELERLTRSMDAAIKDVSAAR